MQRGETCGYISDARLKEKTGADPYCISAELPHWNIYLLPKKGGKSKLVSPHSLLLVIICSIITNKDYFTVLMANHGTRARTYGGEHGARH